MTPERRPERLPPVVRQLGAVSFFNDLASEMVYPLLPALVTVRLGGTALSLAALDGIAEAVSSGAKLAAGWLAERRRWRPALVVGGYAVAAVARPLMGLVAAAWQVVGLRAVDRAGKGTRNPPRDAVIADATAAALHGRAFGFHRAMDHAGAVVGPLAASALLAVGGLAVSAVVLSSAVPGALAAVVALWAMTRLPTHADGALPEDAPVTPPPSPLVEDGRRRTLSLIVAFAFVRFPETLLLLRLHDLGVGLAAVPALWALLHVVRAAASYPGGWLSDTMGPFHTMQAGWVVYAVVCGGMAVSSTPLAGAAWFLIFGLVAATTESPERALVASLGARARRGRRYGVYHAAVGLAALPGALLFGTAYVHLGGPSALALSAGAALLLAVVGAWPRPARARPAPPGQGVM